MPSDASDQFTKRLKLMLSQPEGQFLEFKQSVSGKMDKEIVAFANSGGGTIIVGIDDGGHVLGISNPNQSISKIESIARNCDPAVPLSVRLIQHTSKNLLLVEIPDGYDKPYSCASGFYLRSGTTSQKMKRDEIVAFLHSSGQVNFEEKPCPKFRYPEDFDHDAFSQFLALAGITKNNMPTEELLENLGVANRDGSRLIFNNAGVLFFAREPTRFLPYTYVDCLLFQGTDKVDILDRKELKFNLMENVRQAMIFLKLHLPVRYEITGLVRKEILEIPESALREAVLNAVIHRDYHFDSANISVDIYRDRVEISDPGGLPPGMTQNDLGRKSVRRNKLLAELFHRIGEVEKVGSGIGRMRNALTAAGLQEPEITVTGFYTIAFQRREADGSEKSSVIGSEKSSEKILELLQGNEHITMKEIADSIGITQRAVEKSIARLKEMGIVRRIGSPKTGRWEITDGLVEKWVEGLVEISEEPSEVANKDQVGFRENFRVKFSVSGNQLERMTRIILRLASNTTVIVKELAEEFGVSVRTIHEDLRRLERWDILRFEGAPKTGTYVLTLKGETLLKEVKTDE